MTGFRKNCRVNGAITCALVLVSLPGLLSAQQVGIIEHVAAGSQGVNIITSGPDGALWFTDGQNIGRMTTAGAFSQYPITGLQGGGITTGPDGALWFTVNSAAIGRITTEGVVSYFPLPGNEAGSFITAGPDGALWFTEVIGNVIGRITTAGAVTYFPIPTMGAFPEGIAAGPDGALWFAESGADKIGRITTNGMITEYPVTAGTQPLWIVTGRDKALWFTGTGNGMIGRMTTDGAFTEFPTVAQAFLSQITVGQGLDLWFSDFGNSAIGKITTSGAVTEYPTPSKVSDLAGLPSSFGITEGPDHAIWFTESINELDQKIGQAVSETASLSVTPDAVQPGREIMLAGSGFAPNEQVNIYANSTSANLVNTAVANGLGAFVISGAANAEPYGPNSLTGVGQKSGNFGIAPFSTESRLTVSPEIAAPGSTITVDGFGFIAEGEVFLYFGPVGTTNHVGNVNSNAVGTFSQSGAFTFTVPVGTLPGQYQVTAGTGFGAKAAVNLTVQ